MYFASYYEDSLLAEGVGKRLPISAAANNKKSDKFAVKSKFTINQTSIASNENIKILKSTDNLSASSNICIALTEESPHQITYGAVPGLWFSMALKTTHMRRKTDGFEEKSIIAPYDISVAGPNMPIEIHLDRPTEAVHVFLRQNMLDEIASELYHTENSDLEILPVFAKNDTSLSMLMRVIQGVLLMPSLHGQLQTDSLVRALTIDFLSKYVAIRSEPLYKHLEDKLKPSQLRRVLDYMQEHLADDIGINNLATIAGVSRTNFIRRFKASMHHTPARYLYLLRIRKARELLMKQDLSISQIAAVCGFADPAHLSVSFKREVGVTPSLFRRDQSI